MMREEVVARKGNLKLVPQQRQEPLSVAVIDDDEASTLYLCEFLKKHSCISTAFNSPNAAFLYLSQCRVKSLREVGDLDCDGPEVTEAGDPPFNLIIADLKMPHIDGITLSQNIKELYPQIPIALITAYASLDVAVSAGKTGIFRVLEKPLSSPKLEELLRDVEAMA